MKEAEIIGLVVLSLITLGSFCAVIGKFTQPINELKVVIQELKDCIVTIRADNETQNKRITEHGKEIEKLKSRVDVVETKVELYHEGNK